MKTIKTKKIITFMLLLSGVFSISHSKAQDCWEGYVWSCWYLSDGQYFCTCVEDGTFYAQACPDGQVLACRYDNSCNYECQCIDIGSVATWLKHGHKCPTGNGGGVGDGHGGGHWHHYGGWLFSDSGTPSNPMDGASLGGIVQNPGSSSTDISFSLTESQHVRLTVFDMTGKLVAKVADDAFDAGSYEFNWSSTELNAGIYFLRMDAGNYHETKKLMVIK